jgi:UDP-N-acetylglucosamine 2-epimerase
MYEYFISFTLSFIIAFSFTPAAKKIAFLAGAVDVPKDSRRMHRKPIARFGGLAIAMGFFITLLFNVIGVNLGVLSTFVPNKQFWGLLIGILIIEAIGAVDDVKQLSAKIKLPFQIAAALVVVYSGTSIQYVTNPFSDFGYSQLHPAISAAVTVFWIVGITNAINLIDGLDGLAAGVSSIASLSLFFVSVLRGDMATAMITSVLAGSTMGFLPYNFNPAKIFMGDTGSTFLGFTLGVISIQGTYKSFTAIAIAIPLLVLAVPLFDTLTAIIRRLLSGKSIMEADRGHLHHRLIDMGLGQRKSVALMYTVSAALGLCAIVLADKGPVIALVLFMSISIFVLLGARFMGEINSVNVEYVETGEDTGASDLSNQKAERMIDRLSIKLGENRVEKIKVMTVFGTRPEAIKMAPLVKELEKYEQIESIVCVTAQHRQMLDQVLERFDITPEYDLNIMQNRQTLIDITTRALEGLSEVLDEVKPHIVLVHGDTTTTFVGSLAAFYKKISVGHVEAGLRTFDKYFPYPEEANRKLTGALADLHFAPTATNRENLLNEGIRDNKIYVTGNTALDALKTTISKEHRFKNEDLKKVDFTGKRVVAVTAHRRENLGDPLKNICHAIKTLADRYEDLVVIYTVHLNPAVQEVAKSILGSHPRVHLIDPLDVEDMHNLMDRSYFIMTDSGGLQEEAPSLGKPVLVLRNETERPEAVEAGTVKVAGTEEGKILSLAVELMDNSEEYSRMAKAVNPYGDGRASERIVHALLYEFGFSSEKPGGFKVNK